jgi:hypothetical protein
MVVCAIGLCGRAFAQGLSTPATADPSAEADELVLQQDADGVWRLVPLRNVVTQVPPPTNPGGSSPLRVPDVFVSGLFLDGQVAGEWAEVTAETTVRVIPSDRWVRMSLGFPEALLLDYAHTGPGEAAPDLSADVTDGSTWLFRGQGEHELTLHLRVQVRKTAAGQNLLLTLPRMPMFVGEFRLRVPAEVSLRGGDDVIVREVQSSTEQTVATGSLPGPHLDLRWQVVDTDAHPVHQAPTDLQLRWLDDAVELSARQEIRFSHAGVKAISVRLPSGGFALSPAGVRLGDPSGTEWWVQPQPTERADWVTLPVDAAIGSILRLDWQMTRPLPGPEEPLVLDGFEVAGTRQQLGTIAVESTDRFRIVRLPESDQSVQRIDVDDLPGSGLVSALAYRLFNGQYRLSLLVEPVEPTLSASPYLFLLIDEDQVTLDAVMQLTVDGGRIRRVPLRWSDPHRTEWTVTSSALTPGELQFALPGTSTEPARADSPASAEPDGNQGTAPTAAAPPFRDWSVLLPDDVVRQAEVGFSATRYLDAEELQQPLRVAFPEVPGARMLTGWVIVGTADNVRAEIAESESDPSLYAGVPRWPVATPEWLPRQPWKVLHLGTPEAGAAVALDVSVHARQVTTSTRVHVSELQDRPRVSQTIRYDVEFGRLDRVRLRIPPVLAAQVPAEYRNQSLQFRLNGELPLSAAWSDWDVDLSLPEPLRGTFEITLDEYAVDRSATAGSDGVSVPVISSFDRPYRELELSVAEVETIAVDVPSPEWTPLKTRPSGRHWISTTPADSIWLSVDRSLARVPQRLTIQTAFVQTAMDDSGSQLTTARYHFPQRARSVVVQLPASAEQLVVEWNGLPDERPQDPAGAPAADGFRILRLTPPVAEGIDGDWLTLRYRTTADAGQWYRAAQVDLPRFGPNVWVEHFLWELQLTSAQHLFSSPGGLTPQFSRVRRTLFWQREPTARYVRHRVARLTGSGYDPDAEKEFGHVYPFVCLGTPVSLQYQTMSKSLIVFLGAGVTLLVSFLVLRVPWLRHPGLWLFLVWCGVLASLWYLEPMLVLLQPAAYGLALPLCAALIERLSQQPTTDTGLLQRLRRELEAHPESGARLPMPRVESSQQIASVLARSAGMSDSAGAGA